MINDKFTLIIGNYLTKISLIDAQVSKLIRVFEEQTQKNKTTINKEIEYFDLDSLSPDENNIFIDMSNIMNNLENQVFYNTVAVSVYSFIEFSLFDFCRLIETQCKVEFKLNEISKEKGIDKVKCFLKRNFDINFGNNKNWFEIKEFKKLRNIIVHKNSSIYEDYTKPLEEQCEYKNFVELKKHVYIETNGDIYIQDFNYLDNIRTKGKELIDDIIREVRESLLK